MKEEKHEYGTIGEPIFICSKNFNKPIADVADLWCIINGHVCPYLIMGLNRTMCASSKPKENE